MGIVIHPANCDCWSCGRGETRPLDRASSRELLGLLTGRNDNFTCTTIRVRFEFEIGTSQNALDESKPVELTVSYIDDSFEQRILPNGDLDPEDAPSLVPRLPHS